MVSVDLLALHMAGLGCAISDLSAMVGSRHGWLQPHVKTARGYRTALLLDEDRVSFSFCCFFSSLFSSCLFLSPP